jgi:hypothetical protein
MAKRSLKAQDQAAEPRLLSQRVGDNASTHLREKRLRKRVHFGRTPPSLRIKKVLIKGNEQKEEPLHYLCFRLSKKSVAGRAAATPKIRK